MQAANRRPVSEQAVWPTCPGCVRWLPFVPLVVVLAAMALAWSGHAPPLPPHGDKLGHVVLYGFAAGGLWLGLPHHRGWALGALVALTVGEEALQVLVPHRTASLADLASDALGIAIAVGLARRFEAARSGLELAR